MKSIKPPIDPNCVSKVRDKLPRPTECPKCGGRVRLVKNSEIYGREYGDWPYAYLCEKRCAYVGVHPGTDIPLGTLADGDTRSARKRAKRLFNALWKGKRTRFHKRADAYAWLADKLGIPVEECHFGWFDRSTANRAGEICWNENLK